MQNEQNISEPAPVPFAVHEAALAFAREIIARQWRAIIFLILIIFLSNMAWLWAWTRYDYVSETVTVESAATGHANYIGTSGDIYNGKDCSQKTEADP